MIIEVQINCLIKRVAKVSYRDIKPENFLLKSKDDITNVKMIDFGLSKDYSEVKIMQTPSGSVIYTYSFLNMTFIALLYCPRSD